MFARFECWFQTRIQRQSIASWFFFAINVALYVGSYLAINEWSFDRGIWNDGVVLAIDRRIPFIPEFIAIYALLYVVPLAAFILLLPRPELFRYVIGFHLLSFIHYLIFLTYPVQNTMRPMIVGDQVSVALAICRFFYDIDRPYNLFPSMHVSIVAYSAAFLSTLRHRTTALFGVVALLIFVSTVATKQHYLLDGVVGAGFGITMAYLVLRRAVRDGDDAD